MRRPPSANGPVLLVSDALAVVLAYYLSFWLRVRLPHFPAVGEWRDRLILVPIGLAAWTVSAGFVGLYGRRKTSFAVESIKLIGASVVATTMIAAFAFMVPDHESRPLVAIFAGSILVLAGAGRLLRRLYVGIQALNDYHRVIVVGEGPEALEVCRGVSARAARGLRLVGLITSEDDEESLNGVNRLGSLDEAESIIRREVVDEVIFAVPRTKLPQIEHALIAVEELGIEAKLSLAFLPNRSSRVRFDLMGSTPLLAFSSGHEKPLQLALKRGFDITVSSLALAFLSPALLLTALAIKLDSRGPVFFKQKRTGLNGREFYLWKFRSMTTDAEARRESLQHRNEMSGPVFKITNDPRITRVGSVLRKTSIDELPQLWNVLRGDMSIVGPRPILELKKWEYDRWHCRRLSVKPGITCTWQISGRNDLDFPTWMKLDLDYIDRWSLALDLMIFLRTIPAVLLGRGAR